MKRPCWNISYVSNILSWMFLYCDFFPYWTHQIFRGWSFSPIRKAGISARLPKPVLLRLSSRLHRDVFSPGFKFQAGLRNWAGFSIQVERLKSPCNWTSRHGISRVIWFNNRWCTTRSLYDTHPNLAYISAQVKISSCTGHKISPPPPTISPPPSPSQAEFSNHPLRK